MKIPTSRNPRRAGDSPHARDRQRPSGPPVLRVVPGAGDVGEGIRWNRVMSARARLSLGYYDRPDVLERLADAVLEEIETD